MMAGAILPALLVLGGKPTNDVLAKQKAEAVDPNDPTLRLFQLLDNSYGGKLEDFYVLADIYSDPKKPGQELQRVLRIEYGKSHPFGKLKIYVRSVGKLAPDQLKTYTPKIVFDFGETDLEKFVKTEPGPLGKTGDLYLRSTEDRPLATSPVTDEARKAYEHLITDYLLPALQKK
jgi:hypothetical protein